MFDVYNDDFPKHLSEMSLDFKLMFVYHISMMVLSIIGNKIQFEIQLGIVVILFYFLFIISIQNKKRNKWKWPGVGLKNVLGAIGTLALGIFFLGAITPRCNPTDSYIFPWFAAGGGIVIFNVLYVLKFITYSKTKFDKQCCDKKMEIEKEVNIIKEPRWKRFLRIGFQVFFLVIWICTITFFWIFNQAYSTGTDIPTADKTEILSDHGIDKYITKQEKTTIEIFEKIMMIGIPFSLLSIFILHFVVGVKIWPNIKTLHEKKK